VNWNHLRAAPDFSGPGGVFAAQSTTPAAGRHAVLEVHVLAPGGAYVQFFNPSDRDAAPYTRTAAEGTLLTHSATTLQIVDGGGGVILFGDTFYGNGLYSAGQTGHTTVTSLGSRLKAGTIYVPEVPLWVPEGGFVGLVAGTAAQAMRASIAIVELWPPA